MSLIFVAYSITTLRGLLQKTSRVCKPLYIGFRSPTQFLALPVTWTLAQTLSNLVTSNEALMTNLWELYLSLPEDQVILIRLLTFPDHKTILIALVFITNCIKGSKKRTKMLCRTAVGARLCITILDVMVRLYDAAEQSDGAQAFNIGYGIFSQVIEKGYVSDLYSKLSMVDEPVTPHQTTLLKIIDSYLQSKRHQKSGVEMSEVHSILSPLLARVFLSSSAYAQAAINHSLGSSPTGPYFLL
jgi:ataxin-10